MRMHTGNPEYVVRDVVVVAYRRWGYRQLRRKLTARFEARSGTLADMTTLPSVPACSERGGRRPGGGDAGHRATGPERQIDGHRELRDRLVSRKTDCWQTALAGWLTARQAARVRQTSIIVCGWRLEHEVADVARVAIQFNHDVVRAVVRANGVVLGKMNDTCTCASRRNASTSAEG